MLREEALRILAEHRAEIDGFGVRSLAIFGSVARDEAGPKSDVDILVEFTKPVGYFEFFDLQRYLRRILKRPVDLVTMNSLRESIRAQVLKEAIRAA
ncbi:MAG TPA: nucleotidyltransferase family protein [Chloroflexota bacterium]|nr:nucleotidyltransferase family protein [Chloroflexota bacterium]